MKNPFWPTYRTKSDKKLPNNEYFESVMTGMIIRLLFCTVFATLVCSGCGLIYKQNIQQGSAIEQEDLDELYEGMNKRQVLFVLGTPSVMDPFNQDRWDYVQTFSRRGSDMVKRTVSLRFENDLLTEIIGRDNPFRAIIDETPGDSNEIATFTKKPAGESQADPQADPPAGTKADPQADPHAASIESAAEEALSTDPDIKAIEERTSEEREYQKDMELLDQTPDDGLSGPDIDG
jgi:outer membrane protein assembly factor BamE